MFIFTNFFAQLLFSVPYHYLNREYIISPLQYQFRVCVVLAFLCPAASLHELRRFVLRRTQVNDCCALYAGIGGKGGLVGEGGLG